MISRWSNCALAVILILLVGCSDRIKSLGEAERVARVKVEEAALSDGVKPADMVLTSSRENVDLKAWELYFENPNRKYNLNVLVGRDGNVEVHRDN